MNVNPHDPLLTIPEAAARMGVSTRRARNILVRNLVQPVRTHSGICVRMHDVDAVKKMHQ